VKGQYFNAQPAGIEEGKPPILLWTANTNNEQEASINMIPIHDFIPSHVEL